MLKNILCSTQCANWQGFSCWPGSGSSSRAEQWVALPALAKTPSANHFHTLSSLFGRTVCFFFAHVNPSGADRRGTLPPWAMKLSHRQGQGAQPARKQLREAQLGSCWAAAAPASAGLMLRAQGSQWRQTACTTHVAGDPSRGHMVEFPWEPIFHLWGNPHSSPFINFYFFPDLSGKAQRISWAAHRASEGSWFLYAYSSLVQPHLPVKSSLPSKPFCNSLCKLQYNYIFPPGELCSCLMPLRVVTEISNVSRHLSDHVASRYRKYFRHKAAIQGTRLPKIAIKPYGSKHSQNCFASHRASN